MVVIRPIELFSLLVNHSAPSGPAVIPSGMSMTVPSPRHRAPARLAVLVLSFPSVDGAVGLRACHRSAARSTIRRTARWSGPEFGDLFCHPHRQHSRDHGLLPRFTSVNVAFWIWRAIPM